MADLYTFRFVLFLVCAEMITSSPGQPTCPQRCKCFIIHPFHEVKCIKAKLTSIPDVLPSKMNTTTMYLSENEIQEISVNSLSSFHSLIALDLKKNKIIKVDRNAFQSLKVITNLDLSHNCISDLDEKTFENNNCLKVIDLSHNPLFLPMNGPFLISKSLSILNLASANLTTMPHNAFNELETLSTLNLTNNILKDLPAKSLDRLRSLKTIILKGNPLRCDCDLKRTWNWSQLNEVNVSDVNCNEPEEVKGYSWQRLKDLQCEPRDTDVTALALYVIVVVLIVIMALVFALVFFFVRRRRKQAYPNRKPPKNRKLPRAPPGEYIEVLPEPKTEPIYEKIEDAKKEVTREEEDQRYVTSRLISARPSRPISVPVPTPPPPVYYTTATHGQDWSPIYANVAGLPLPQRRPDPDHGPLAPPDASPPKPTPAPRLVRPCSNPLLQGCDFYEIVE